MPTEKASVRDYFELVSRTLVLGTTLATVLILVLGVFPALPIGGEMLDLKAGYAYPEVIAAMESYGEPGRRVYAWSSAMLDTLLPVVYVSLLAGLLYRFRPTERLWKLAYLPLAAGALDLGENGLIILMLTRYPDVSAREAATASFFTVSKGYVILGCLALAVTLAAATAVRARRRRIDRAS